VIASKKFDGGVVGQSTTSTPRKVDAVRRRNWTAPGSIYDVSLSSSPVYAVCGRRTQIVTLQTRTEFVGRLRVVVVEWPFHLLPTNTQRRMSNGLL